MWSRYHHGMELASTSQLLASHPRYTEVCKKHAQGPTLLPHMELDALGRSLHLSCGDVSDSCQFPKLQLPLTRLLSQAFLCIDNSHLETTWVNMESLRGVPAERAELLRGAVHDAYKSCSSSKVGKASGSRLRFVKPSLRLRYSTR